MTYNNYNVALLHIKLYGVSCDCFVKFVMKILGCSKNNIWIKISKSLF